MLTLNQFYLLIPAVITALVGSSVQFAYKSDEEASHTVAQRLVSTFAGWVLACLLAAIFLVIWNWHFLIVAVANLLFGLVAEKLVRLFLDYMRAAKDLEDFARRGKRAYDAFKDSVPNDKNEPPANPPVS